MSHKTIFIDGLGLVDGHFSGIGQYILGTLRGIDAILEKEKLAGNKVPRIKVIIPFDELRKFKAFKFKHLEAKRFPLPFRYMAALWHRGKLPPVDLWCGRGHYIFTRFVAMPLLFSDYSIIVYDLSFELHKEYSDDGNARFLSLGTKKSVERATNVFTISENAKREISQVYDISAQRIHVATPAADQRYFYRRSQAEIRAVKDKYGIKGSYVLALSNLEPRKNLDTLVDAYCSLPRTLRSKYQLLLVGVSGWKTDALFDKIINKVQSGFNITRPSKYVSDKDKAAIISGASLLVYPSHYEGFGMPPLEALACGVPVITADNSSLPEVVGKSGVMLDHLDTAGFTKAMQEHLDNIQTLTAESAIKGPLQARHFSWEKSAQTYWDVIRKQSL